MQSPAPIRARVSWDRLTDRDVLDPAIAIVATLVFLIAGHDNRWTIWTVLGVTLPIAVVRRLPLVVLAAISVTTALTQGVGGWVDVAAMLGAAAAAGSGHRRTEPSLALVVLDALCVGVALVAENAELWAVVAPMVIVVPGWLLGDAIRARRLGAQARVVEEADRVRVQEAAIREAAREERRHMARELHDIVAHSVSVMVIQAGAARQVIATDPARATESLLAIESTGREAMTELRRIVGVLGEAGDEIELAPQPGVSQLSSLVERVVEAGLPVEFHVEGDPRPLPPTVDVTAYRIVQEALTNALKYAGRATTSVGVEYRATGLRLEIADDGNVDTDAPATASHGRGLVGMRERAVQCGGTLEAGPRLGGGFAVRAWLPTGAGG